MTSQPTQPSDSARARAKEVREAWWPETMPRFDADELEGLLAVALDAFRQAGVEQAMAEAVKNTDMLLTIERESFRLRDNETRARVEQAEKERDEAKQGWSNQTVDAAHDYLEKQRLEQRIASLEAELARVGEELAASRQTRQQAIDERNAARAKAEASRG